MGESAHPVRDSLTHGFWYGHATRSDGQLALNNGDTYLRITTSSNELGANVTSGARGGQVTNLPTGIYYCRMLIQTAEMNGAYLNTRFETNGAYLTPCNNEATPGGDAFTSIATEGIIRITDKTQYIRPFISTNKAGPLRTAINLGIVRM